MSWVDAVQIVKGPIASRPAANAVPPNKYGWFATDTLVLSISDGSVWTDIGPGSGGVPTSRTLTAGAALTGGGTLAADRTFDVAVDGSTIEVSSDALRVKADGITANEIAAGAVGASELAATAVTPATYGDATHVAQVTVDADGRITGAADVAITGAGGGSPWAVETPSGTINGSNDTFTLSAAPDPAADLLLWKNGLLMKAGGVDYTLTGTSIVFVAGQIPPTGAILLAALPGATSGGGGGVIVKRYFNKPAGNITRAGTTVGAFSTAWQIPSVVVASGENILLRVRATASRPNTDTLLALFRDSTQIASTIWSAQGSIVHDLNFEWIDANPGAATYTYEVRAAQFVSGTLTVFQTNITTDVGGGGSIFLAEVYTP